VHFFSCSAGHRRFKKTQNKKSVQTPLFLFVHAPPVAVARGKTRRHCSCCSRMFPNTVKDFWGSVL
jgi:hypothetical protein